MMSMPNDAQMMPMPNDAQMMPWYPNDAMMPKWDAEEGIPLSYIRYIFLVKFFEHF
jgi:hypothetical protein